MSTPCKISSAGQAHPFAHGSHDHRGLTMLLVLLIGAWLLAAVIIGAAGFFELGPTRPPLPLLVGVLLPPAVFVLRAMIDGSPSWRRRVLLLNLGGLLDFVVALGTGVLTSNTSIGIFAPATPMASMGTMPLSLIPTFAVPLWTIIHIASLLQLRRARG